MPLFRLPFLEDTTPPPFYQAWLSDAERVELDRWFIGHRSQAYYLKRFHEFDKAGRLKPRWHWAAFFMTFGWLLYRKRYLDCLVYCIAGWAFIKVTIVLTLAALQFVVIPLLPHDYQLAVSAVVGLSLWFFWAGMVARWSDAYYYRQARREIADVLELYPHDKEQQKAHLQHEGGVSLFGMGIAFALFAGLLSIIVVHFVPLIADQKQHNLLYDVYIETNVITKRIEKIYRQTGQCPVGMAVSGDLPAAEFKIVGQVTGQKTDCAVVATVMGQYYPIHYLNGRKLTMYRSVNDKGQVLWHCQSTLNKKQKPKNCIS